MTIDDVIHSIATSGMIMPKQRSSLDQNMLFFPDPEATDLERQCGSIGRPPPPAVTNPTVTSSGHHPGLPACEVVISGTYRKDFETLRRTYEEFLDLGCTVLSPSNVSIAHEHDGFVYMDGEEKQTPDKIEARHLGAIQRASFVWLHVPEGYVGPTAALEVGFANAAGVPVYAKQAPSDSVLQSFVRVVASPADLVIGPMRRREPPAPALKAFQEYYRRAALERGYAKEGPNECLLLMVEEVGELARALRKRERLVRHGSYDGISEAQELADVFLYVVHMANVLGFDLSYIVRNKEIMNLEKFLAR